ncbi:ATP-binding protein [Pseudomonas benzopyrenica]|uniref:ATP-binding protein n=1 Tax=Pseudomonas benzopyrenica TaxID=2993566 RepID=UPI003F176AB2
MKLPIKLHTRLFLSISALIAVALIGLLVGLVSVLHLAREQSVQTRSNLDFINLTLNMRQELSNSLFQMLDGAPNPQSLVAAQQRFQEYLELVEGQMRNPEQLAILEDVKQRYQRFADYLRSPPAGYSELRADRGFQQTLNALRTRIYDLQRSYVVTLERMQDEAHDRAVIIALLLALIGVAILVTGVVTANGIARRFTGPIDGLAKAAERISQGNFDVQLPTSQIAEFTLLSRRFGNMAQALHRLSQTNVEALVAGQRRLQAVLDSIDYGLVILDPQGNIEHANPVACRQLGWNENHLGESLIAALERPEIEASVQRVLAGGALDAAPEDLEIRVDDEVRLLAWSLTPVNHADGRSVGALMVLRDVTEQRAFDRVRNEFVLRASHELRTPVTGMHMAFGLLRERLKVAPDSREAFLLQTVDEETHRLVQLINDLLDYSRHQSGLQRPEKLPSEIGELLEAARGRHADEARERDVELTVELLHTPLPRVSLDPKQLGRVFDNLLSNALRHTPAGGRIVIQALRQNDQLLMAVQDNGEGIAYAQQGRVFEPFVQIGSQKGGAGLGLALCKEIIRQHGGRIGVVSRPGQGTQIFMTLPT